MNTHYNSCTLCGGDGHTQSNCPWRGFTEIKANHLPPCNLEFKPPESIGPRDKRVESLKEEA